MLDLVALVYTSSLAPHARTLGTRPGGGSEPGDLLSERGPGCPGRVWKKTEDLDMECNILR